MTGQLITPAAAVFPGLAAAAVAKRGVGGGGSLELGIGSVSAPGSIRTENRGLAVEAPNTTLFGFKPKPKSGANTRHAIQFLH